MTQLAPGQDGEPLPEGAWVLRVCKRKTMSKGEVFHELHFLPSSEDEKDPKHRLSAWEETNTGNHVFHLSNTPSSEAALARLNVDDVRGLSPAPEKPGLEVEWHPLLDEGGAPDPRPGAGGHSGIHDLTAGNKHAKRNIRSNLARLAREGHERTRPNEGLLT